MLGHREKGRNLMKKFEYKVVHVKRKTFSSGEQYVEHFAAELNTLGADGWELIEVSGNPTVEGFVVQVFKREIQ